MFDKTNTLVFTYEDRYCYSLRTYCFRSAVDTSGVEIHKGSLELRIVDDTGVVCMASIYT